MHCPLTLKSFPFVTSVSNIQSTLSVNPGILLYLSTLVLPIILASPVPDATPKNLDKVDPYAPGNLEWQEYDISRLFNTTDDDKDSMEARDSDQLQDFTNLVAHKICVTSGIEVAGTTVSKYATKACSMLLRKNAALAAIDGGWKAWQVFNLEDSEGDRSMINFRFRKVGDEDKAPTLTGKLCKKVMDDITTTLCVKEGKTHGGAISLKPEKGGGELQLGFDPNDQNQDMVDPSSFC